MYQQCFESFSCHSSRPSVICVTDWLRGEIIVSVATNSDLPVERPVFLF